MKLRTYFGFALFLPFLLWLICLLISLMASGADLSSPPDTFFIPIAYYTVGIILWFIPYTILAIGLWNWSKNKETIEIRNAALATPFIFYLLLLGEAVLTFTVTNSMTDFASTMPEAALIIGVLSLGFGYLCVGVGMGIFKLLQANNLIKNEAPQGN